MFFKNAILYRLDTTGINAQDFEQKLAARPFIGIGASEMSSRGWSQPAEDGRFVIPVQGRYLFSLMTERKLLPSSVINQVAADKAKLIEEQQGYKPSRKQMKEIKEAVLQELLPRAFTRRRRVFGYIDVEGGWLVIDASGHSLTEEVLESLRDTLDSLPVKLVKTKLSPVSVMTSWLAAGEANGSFTIDCDCELRAVTDKKAAVRYVRHALDGKDVQDHLAAGKQPTRIALTFDDRVSFVLTEAMAIKRLAFLDVIKEEADKNAESADMQMEADFAIMSGEISRLLPSLIEALGGEENQSIF